jgi:stearoyl-CoA desaturase (delta-9 desaturase)
MPTSAELQEPMCVANYTDDPTMIKRRASKKNGQATTSVGTGKKKKKKVPSIFNKWWITGVGIAVNHIIGVYAILWHYDAPAVYWWLCLLMGSLQLLGITAGIHRLWSHQAFQAATPVRYCLAIWSMAAWQGSIKWWALRHRLHHRYTDTDLDPYDARRGFFYTHFGWLFTKPEYELAFSTIDVSDLARDPVVAWNTTYYPTAVILFGFFFPTILGHVVGVKYVDDDTWQGHGAWLGFLYIGVIARIISWNGIFLINSYAHWTGAKAFNRDISAATSFLAAFLSMGEGNHNFHHEFPKDCRHGVRWYAWDPTKWLLFALEAFGGAWQLYRSDAHLITQSELQQNIKRAQEELEEAQQLYRVHMACAPREYATPAPKSLPAWTRAKLKAHAQDRPGHVLVLLDGFVLDLTLFKEDHPGGARLLKAYHGRDATEAFHHGRNMHSPAAANLAARYRIARLVDN